MEDNSGKKFSLQDWVMKRAANQSGASMPSQSARSYLSEKAEEDELIIQKTETVTQSVEVEMKAVSNGSTIPSMPIAAAAPAPKEEAKAPVESSLPKKEDTKKEDIKEATLSLASAQNPLQQLQIVRLLTDLGDRLRQSEKEREILWKEVEICRKQIADMNGANGKSEQTIINLENQINQKEVFVKELVEKQMGLEQQLKTQMSAMEEAKLEQNKFNEKLNSVETATGSAIVRVEDIISENSKLAKRVEQLGQDKARLVRKLEVVEEALTQTQDILKAKALVLLTDQAVAAKTSLPQAPAWTGDDTIKVSQASQANSGAAQQSSPVSSLAASLQKKQQPSLFVVAIVTALIATLAAFGAIWVLKNMDRKDEVIIPQSESPAKETAPSEKTESGTTPDQSELMAQAAKIANQIEPSSLTEQDEVLEKGDSKADAVSLPTAVDESSPEVFASAQEAQEKAVASFSSSAPKGSISNRIRSDRALPQPIANIEKQAFAGDIAAQHDLAAIYTAGHSGVKVDYAKAAKWFEEASHNGSSNAQYNLGVLYHQGLGVRKDTAKAISLYRVAAASKHPEALYNLAIAYVEGVGVEYNPQIAAVYFERSADAGIVEAAYNLGLLQENGLLGESQPDEAIFWYKVAADKGNPDASKSLSELKAKLSMKDEDVNRIVKKIAATKPDYLKEDGTVSIPELKKPELSSQSAAESQPQQEPAPESKPIAPPTKPVALSEKVDPVIISQIQEQLMRLGLFKGVPNGTQSPMLSQAIKAYQVKNGIKPDGKPSDDLLVQMLVSGAEVKSQPEANN